MMKMILMKEMMMVLKRALATEEEVEETKNKTKAKKKIML